MKVNTRKNVRKEVEDVKTTNYEGGEAFKLSPKSKLVQLTSTCLFGEPKFYGELGETEQKIVDTATEVAEHNPKFLLQLAQYLRNEQYLRSISNYLLVFSANQLSSKQYVREYAPNIIKRADELTESITMQLDIFGKPIPNSLKKGIRDSFLNFDSYQFSKYNRKNSKGVVTFKDAIMLTHPKQPSELIKKILNDKLETPLTWETELSTKGNKKEVWENLIIKKKVPYMATLRNLRNILNTKVDVQYIKMICDYISDPENVRRSRQFPFRFFSAYRAIESNSNPHTSKLLDALEDAIVVSYKNIPKLPGTTLIACDVSGSMEQPISKNSSVQRFDIGLLLGAMAHKFTDDSIVGIFGDTWKPINLSKRSGIIKDTLYMHKREGEVGYSTNAHLVIEWAIEENVHVDRFMFFSDNQIWNSKGCSWRSNYSQNVLDSGDMKTAYQKFLEYKRKVNHNAKIVIFDLAGYGTTSFPEQDKSVIGIGGWSDKIFKFLKDLDTSPEEQVNYIESKY